MMATVYELALLLVIFSPLTLAHKGHHHHFTKNDSRSCNDSHVDKDIVDDKTYQVATWPQYEEIETCIIELDPITVMKRAIPHTCALKVNVRITLLDFVSINADEQLITIKLRYQESWTDKRIILPSLMNQMCSATTRLRSQMYLEPISLYRDRIWTPDFYIENLRSSRTISLGRRFEALILFKTYVIRHIATLHIDLMCPMLFDTYPFDTQECNITLASYGIAYDRLAIVWHGKKVESLPAFKLEGYDIYYEALNPEITEAQNGYHYPLLKVRLVIRRQRFKFVLLIFVPSVLHFMIAWLAIFLPKEVAQGRCIINCSTMLSLVSMLGVYNRYSPYGGFVKSLDIWSYFSILFQFLCLLDAMLDTRLMYAATNMKRNPSEARTKNIWNLVTSKSNWLGREVQLVKTQDEGASFDDTARDMRRMTIHDKQVHEISRELHASHPNDLSPNEQAEMERLTQISKAMHAPYRLAPGYFRFLKLLIFYQGWSQYIICIWYLTFIVAYISLCVPPLVPIAGTKVGEDTVIEF